MSAQRIAATAEAEDILVAEAGRNENASIPLGRPAEPSEIAAAVVFLAGPDASCLTGGRRHGTGYLNNLIKSGGSINK